MSKRDEIEELLRREFSPSHLDVVDESFMHSVPDDAESHFKVVLASAAFSGKPLIARHRAVNRVVNITERNIHALALHTFTPEEWTEQQDTQSPDCLGGNGK